MSAGSGEEVLTLMSEKGAPDVVVADVMMPGMSGLDLHARLRENPAYVDIPSSSSAPGWIRTTSPPEKGIGPVCLTKPVVLSAVKRAIDNAVTPAGGTW